MNWDELKEKLERRNQEAFAGGGEERVQKQHSQSKLTARERLEILLDEGSFLELDRLVVHQCTDFGMGEKKFPGDGVVCGSGKIYGRQVFVYSQDFTVLGGSLSNAQAKKICKIMDLALKTGAPLIGINDSGGARIQEGVMSLGGYGEIFLRNSLASGVIPQVSLIMGPCAGGAVYSPGLTDFILMTRSSSYMFITGPDVVKEYTGEEIDHYSLGGANVHSELSGVCDLVGEDDRKTLELARRLLSYLPQNNQEDPPVLDTNDPVERSLSDVFKIVPTDSRTGYDIRDLLELVFDEGSFFELKPEYARNIVIGFARLGGYCVGVVANQPIHLAGVIDSRAARKAARFVRFCDAFNIPIITFVDVPGFMPGSSEESEGIINHGAKLIFAYSEATVPKLSVIVRKAYGGAYIVMSSKHLRGDLNFAYPTAEIAVMGPEAAVNIVFKKEIDSAEDKEKKRAELIQRYREKFASPYQSAELGYIDEVISPEQTRIRLFQGLEMLLDKVDRNPKKKHPNPPL